MKFLFSRKDGGKKSNCTGYWLIEWKGGFSVLLLRFTGRSREVFHSHAFDCFGLVLTGGLIERNARGKIRKFTPQSGFFGIYKNDVHRVSAMIGRDTWVFTVRGPWDKTWFEWDRRLKELRTLGNGRVTLALDESLNGGKE